MLLDEGCDPNIPNNDGFTAMNIAIIKRRQNIIDLFKDYECEDDLYPEDPNIQHNFSKKTEIRSRTEVENFLYM